MEVAAVAKGAEVIPVLEEEEEQEEEDVEVWACPRKWHFTRRSARFCSNLCDLDWLWPHPV